MNEPRFINGIICENITNSGEIITTQPDGKIISSGLQTSKLSDYEVFYNSNLYRWNDNVKQNMILNTQVRGHSNYSTTGTEISVNESDEYTIQVSLSLMNFSGGRTNVTSWIELNGIEVGGTRGLTYLRIANHGASCSMITVLDLIPTDSISVVSIRSIGTGECEQISNGSSMLIKRGFV